MDSPDLNTSLLTTINDDLSSNQSISAICCNQKSLGIACYNEINNTIYADNINTTAEDIGDILHNFKRSFKPTMLILHPRLIANKSLLDSILSGPNYEPNYYTYKAIKSMNWNQKLCMQLIYNNLAIKDVRMGRNATNIDQSDNIGSNTTSLTFQKVSSYIDLESEQLCQALSALLTFMQENIFHLDNGKVTINAVKQLPLQSVMRIDSASMKALQIFSEEIHPNVIRGVGKSKEGFSLFGLFDRTHSILGRNKLRQWMNRPFSDINKILNRQKGVSLAIRANNRPIIEAITPLLRHFHDLPRLILRVKKVEANCTDWCKVHTSIISGLKIMDYLYSFIHNRPNETDLNDINYIKELIEYLDVTLIKQFSVALDEAIDFNESGSEGYIIINRGFDSELDELRHVYDNLEECLIEAAHRVLDAVPLLENVAVEYIPQVGYLVAVHESNIHYLKFSVSSNGNGKRDLSQINNNNENNNNEFSLVYSQDSIYYYKHSTVYQLDDEIGDIKSNIIDRSKLILLQVEDILLDLESQLQHLSFIVATLDALISLGTIAIEHNLIQPEIVEDSIIIIKKGRHLLQELTVDTFIPNDTYITTEKNIGIITGPNNSGKSVYLKQVGLMVYLAHIGSFIPCEKAIIGLTDRLLTRISSIESVSSPQSSFSLDLTQICKMLSSHTPRSLCLIDEFGKGTSPVDGIALLGAIIKHFSVHKSACLFAIHFTEVLNPNILNKQDMLSITCFCMDAIIKQSSLKDNTSHLLEIGDDLDMLDEGDEVTPLYKLQLGITTSSEGIPCARSSGVPSDVLTRALFIKSSIENKKEIIATSVNNRTAAVENPTNKKLLEQFLTSPNWLDSDCKKKIEEILQLL
eukprot:gene12141-16255_t